MEKLTGTCTIRVDGKSIRSKEKAELEAGGFERTPVFADGKLIGYTEKPVESKVKATCAHGATSDLIALGNITNATLIFETDTGVRFLVANSVSRGPAKLTGGEGDAAIEFFGQPAVQI